MKLGLLIWIVSIYGLVFNSKNFIKMLICLELMLLSISLMVIYNSIVLDDIVGQIMGFYIVAIAGAESAIGLSILMTYFRLRGNISILDKLDKMSEISIKK